MLAYIKGEIVEIINDKVYLECGGIGYEIAATNNTISRLSSLKLAPVKLFVYMSVKEDGVFLYGFLDEIEKKAFLQLISVSGVGAKVALGVLSGISVNALAAAVVNGNSDMLVRIKGVGKKTAERIILELKDKMESEGAAFVGASKNTQDAINALVSLGYSKVEAVKAIGNVENASELSVEDIIRSALR